MLWTRNYPVLFAEHAEISRVFSLSSELTGQEGRQKYKQKNYCIINSVIEICTRYRHAERRTHGRGLEDIKEDS